MRLVSQADKLEQRDVRLNVFHKTQILSRNFRIEEIMIKVLRLTTIHFVWHCRKQFQGRKVL